MLDQVISVGGVLRAAAFRLARHRRTPAVVAGIAIGVAGWSAVHPFVAAFGFNRETVMGLTLAAAGAFAAGLRASRRRSEIETYGLPALVAAAWLVLLPAVLSAATWTVGSVPVGWLELDGLRAGVLALAGLVAFGVPAFCAGLVTERHRRDRNGVTLLATVGLGIAVNAFVLAPAVGLHLPLLFVAVASAVAWFVNLARGGSSPRVADAASQSSVSKADTVAAVFCAALVAVGCAICGRVLAQLTSEVPYLVAVGIAALLIGLAGGAGLAGWLRRRTGDDNVARRCGAGLAAVGTLLPLAAFGWLVDRHLDANAYVSSVFWLMVIRGGTVAAVVLPLAIGCGLATAGLARTGRAEFVACAFAVGLVLAGWALPAVGVVALATTAAGALVATAIAARPFRPGSRRGWAAAAACGLALAAVTANVGRYEPVRAARLLFSTEAFLARQSGMPAKLLPYLSDARLATMSETADGTVTVWNHRGEGRFVRIDGVPVAATSRRPDRCPLPSADVMRVALPLVLHQNPDSVLLLGDPAGLGTQIASRFPVRTIVCFDATDGDGTTAVSDDRIAFAGLEPRLALAAQRQRFDVVVSDPGVPGVLAGAPYFTQEFYSLAAARLTDDGIFCQRLRYADFGPGPLRVIAATMRSVFDGVTTIEIGSGEYAVLGVRPGAKLVRDGLLERLKRPHVRRTLAAFGWDWCVPLNLPTVGEAGMKSLAAEAPAVHTDADGRFAYALPRETMRWGPKWQELHDATAALTSRPLMAVVPDADGRDVLERIAEVTGQRALMTRFPDQPWAYRKEVRKKLVETPRSVIRPVSGEVRRALHPDDRRRLDYFAALGKAVSETNPATLAGLEEFAEPYDPLITYFLHHEIAPLYAELGVAGDEGELTHRLYAAYYADPRDRSVRNVAATLQLLVAKPQLVPDEAARFDHLNGLIEVLLGRWEVRGMTEPRSPAIVMEDIDQSLDATEAALGAMDSQASAAGLSNEDWRLRKAAIERTMTRPLRKYRTALLPHLRAARRKAAEGEEGE